jgi:hypothetical protein
VRIGRALDNDVVLGDLLVSRHHAELRRSGEQWELVDLGSANGTYVNGVRIARAALGPTDLVVIGHQRLHMAGDRLEEYIDAGDVSFEASGLTVATEKGRVLLDNVSFAFAAAQLLGRGRADRCREVHAARCAHGVPPCAGRAGLLRRT